MRPSIEKNGKRFYILDTVEAFAVGFGRRYEIAGNDIAVFRIGETFRAFGNACPHQGGSLSQGSVKQGCRIECPKHGWTFDVVSGQRVNDATVTIPTYETIVSDGNVWVCVDACLYVPQKKEEPDARSLLDYD